MRKLVIFLLILFCLVSMTATCFAGQWFGDRKGVLVWNSDPNPGESIRWEGSVAYYHGSAYAEGQGTLYWYREGNFHHRTFGIWHQGVLEDGSRAVCIYNDGTRKEGTVYNGVINYD